MLAMPVVVVKPTRQVLCPLGKVCIGGCISPFAQRRLDGALCLSVGLPRLRAYEPMSDRKLKNFANR